MRDISQGCPADQIPRGECFLILFSLFLSFSLSPFLSFSLSLSGPSRWVAEGHTVSLFVSAVDGDEVYK